MGSVKMEPHGNIGDDEIQYQLKIDTGHVENTDTPNRVPYTFPVPASLETEGYILRQLKLHESSRVGNCYINYAIQNNSIRLDAVAQTVRDASRLFYKAGGHLKGTAILTFQKITPETEEIKYEFNVDTGHVENTDTPNRVSYTFPIDFHLLKQSYTVSKFEFSESYHVGNCFIHPTIEKGVIKIEAVAQAVKASSGLWYKAGGHLKGTVRVTLRKTEYVGADSKYETSQATIIMNGNQYNISGDIYSEIVNLGKITGDVSTRIEKTNEVSVMTMNESIHQSGNFGIGHMSGGTIQGNAKVAGIINETISEAKGKSLAEAAAEIQQLLDQLSQTYPPAEVEQKVAEELANRAKQDPSVKESLKSWSLSLVGKGVETGVIEGVKRVIPLAISFLI